MKDILVLGSLNMDMVTKVADIPVAGETILGGNLDFIPGGKGANQATAIGKLGGSATMLGVVGDDNYGEILLKNLASNKVEVEHINKTNETATGLAFIMVNSDGNNSIVVVPGANNQLKKNIIDKMDISKFDIVVAQMEIPVESIEYTFKKAKSNGAYTILNPAPAQPLSDDLFKNVDLLIPNETEFEILTRHSVDVEKEIELGIEYLKNKGVKEIIITLGENGAKYFNKNGDDIWLKSYDVDVIDTTAAGDSFIGAIATALSKGKNMIEAIDFAMKVAAITVGKLGAQVSLPTLEQVNDFVGTKRS